MNSLQAQRFGQAIRAVQPRQMGALPLFQPILADLQVRDSVNQLLPSQADVELGQIVVLLVLNRLLAPQPLYEIQDWLSGTVLPEVLTIQVQQAYDNRLGRALDRLYPQLGELWQRLVSRAIQVYDLDLTVLHWDLTSIYFEGAYADSQLATYGYSRDQRPDAKLINLQVDVSQDGQVTVLHQILAGNAADITRPLPHLEALLRFLARPELAQRHLRPLLVSDSKLIAAKPSWPTIVANSLTWGRCPTVTPCPRCLAVCRRPHWRSTCWPTCAAGAAERRNIRALPGGLANLHFRTRR